MPAIDVTFAYAAHSELRERDEHAELGLASTAQGTFVDGFVERADVVSAGLLTVGRVAATRFYTVMSASKLAELTDPIITTGDGRVRFESLSACCGVAARLDLLPSGLDAGEHTPGTTNVDLGPRMRQLLSGVLRRDPMRVRVGEAGLEIRTLAGGAHERRVALPERWVRSLAELQVLASGMSLRFELDQREARSLFRSMPRRTPPHGFFSVHRAAGGFRFGVTAVPGAVAVGGPERLLAIEPVLRQATSLRVYAPEADGPAASWWELELPHARLGVGLSPETSRGFSGEGALLLDLAVGSPDAYLAAAGQLGYDLADGGYYARLLPFGRDVLQTHPRLEKAERLVAGGGVWTEADHLVVRGTRFDHVVRLGAKPTCTCRWFADHGGSRGPCAHVLAARVFAEPALAELALRSASGTGAP